MLSASKHRLHEFMIAQDQDTMCAQAKKWCTEGWPTKHLLADGVLEGVLEGEKFLYGMQQFTVPN